MVKKLEVKTTQNAGMVGQCNASSIAWYFCLENKETKLKLLNHFLLKGRVQCFSMQIIMNKCFFLNFEKSLAWLRLVVFEKNAKTCTLTPKNDVKLAEG